MFAGGTDMGWASGSDVMDYIIYHVQRVLPHDPEIRCAIYIIVIKALDAHDWDTHDDCWGQDDEFDEALKELHPEFKD
jgi:hypothetical protein